MGKVYIVLDDSEQVELERICLDKEPGDALRFVLKTIVPKLRKQVPCLSGEYMRSERF